MRDSNSEYIPSTEVTRDMAGAALVAMEPYYLGDGVYDLSEACFAAILRALASRGSPPAGAEVSVEETTELDMASWAARCDAAKVHL